jgi:hypothetical protein
MRKTILVVATLAGFALRADAEVTRVEVASRADVGASGYEKIVGTIHFAIDPGDPRNRVIVDIDKVATNADRKVEFSADLYILRPKDAARSNGVALIEVSNRGNKGLLSEFSRASEGGRDPSTDADLGDGFLTKAGYTLVWVGWQFDVRQANRIKFNPPRATGLTVVVRAEFTPNDRSTETTLADLAGYALQDPNGADATLTVRDGPYGKPETVARSRWQLRGTTVSMPGGFEAGRTYEVSVPAKDVPVAGAGLAAFRDTASWLKYRPEALATARYAYSYGTSQSGRFLRTFLYYGFNTDEQGRQVFDGILAHIAGGARLSLNERSATPNSLAMFSATAFPFSDPAQRDPLSGKTEGLLENPRAKQNQPKVFYTNSDVEYWGGGRSAALVHTSADGKSDLTLPDNVRAYLLTGTQHSPGQFPPRATTGQQRDNPVAYWWTLRALLVAMDGWVRRGEVPPASQIPRLSDGTLVKASEIKFPAIPGVQSPRTIPGARQGESMLPFLVPAVDADGNELAGIRSPEQSVPVATYTGWNFRNQQIGGTGQLVSLMGSSIPFARTAAERQAGDTRRAISERYASKDQYLAKAREQAERLVQQKYLLAEDVGAVMKRMEDQWLEATAIRN